MSSPLSFGQVLQMLRKQSGLTLAELGEKVEMSGQGLSLIEQGTSNVKRNPDIVAKLETALKLRPGELAKYLPPDHPARRMSTTASGASLKFIGAISAGKFTPLLPAEPGEYVDVRTRFPEGSEIAVVSGDSCARFGLFDGDWVAVRREVRPEDGQFVVAETGEGLVLKWHWDGKLYRWHPNQPEPEVVPLDEDTTVKGVVAQRVGDVRRSYEDVRAMAGLPELKHAKKKGRK